MRILLSNNKIIEPCIAEYLTAPGYEMLREIFEQVYVEEWGHGVKWPGDIGVSFTTLYRLAKEQSGKAYPVAEFHQWMKDNHLSANSAARALGLTRRTIIYFHTGKKTIPLVVGLACEGYNVRLKLAA